MDSNTFTVDELLHFFGPSNLQNINIENVFRKLKINTGDKMETMNTLNKFCRYFNYIVKIIQCF